MSGPEKLAPVISLDIYRDTKKIVDISKSDCPRPFHLDEYVEDDSCYKCDQQVRQVQHPSFEGPRWYG